MHTFKLKFYWEKFNLFIKLNKLKNKLDIQPSNYNSL